MAKLEVKQTQSASDLISERINELGDWRGEILAQVRKAFPFGRAKE